MIEIDDYIKEMRKDSEDARILDEIAEEFKLVEFELVKTSYFL